MSAESQFKWNLNARYRSNNGKGPMIARIVGVTETHLKMERWYEKRPHSRRVPFELPISFLDSPSCGWMLITAEEAA
jgi:hypothetical protein